LTQRQPGDAYKIPLEIGLEMTDGTRRSDKIEFSEKQQVFKVPASESPSAVVLDPNTWVLMSAQFVKR
jgi:hypothetical protein